MRITRFLIAVLGAGVTAARAQEPPPFHRGQWGAEFGLSYSFASIGAIAFRSPTRAWVIDGSTSYTRNESRYSDTTVNVRNTSDRGGLTLRLGRRGYRPIGARAYRTVTGGLLGSASFERSSSPYSPRQHQYSAGVFAELGAQWMVSPQLSLGALWGLSLRYWVQSSHATYQKASGHSLDFSVGNFGLRGGFYF